jgi:hypothetical protein
MEDKKMGLDMYLYKEIFVGAQYEHRNVKGTISITTGDKDIPVPVNFERVSEIRERVAYWRKANAIHKWFVDNCQDGVDECQESPLTYEELNTLLELCKRIKANNSLAGELLPTQSGFFFGSTDYDNWYFEDINSTIEQLELVLKEPDAKMSDYIYRSSW